AGQIERQRHLVAHDQALRRLFAGLAVIKTAPDGDQKGEQKQRAADTEHGQDAAALVAEGVLGDKASQGHNELREPAGRARPKPQAAFYQDRRKVPAPVTASHPEIMKSVLLDK